MLFSRFGRILLFMDPRTVDRFIRIAPWCLLVAIVCWVGARQTIGDRYAVCTPVALGWWAFGGLTPRDWHARRNLRIAALIVIVFNLVACASLLVVLVAFLEDGEKASFWDVLRCVDLVTAIALLCMHCRFLATVGAGNRHCGRPVT